MERISPSRRAAAILVLPLLALAVLFVVLALSSEVLFLVLALIGLGIAVGSGGR